MYPKGTPLPRNVAPRDRDKVHQRWQSQAERTAWRNLVDWLDASLAAVSIGLQTMDEVFLAHAVLETSDGQRGRFIDYVQTAYAAGGRLPAIPNADRLLPSGRGKDGDA